MPEQPHYRILLVHCRYRLPGGEDAVFEAERAMLQAHGHEVITYERSTAEGGALQKLLLPFRAVVSFKPLRQVRALLAGKGAGGADAAQFPAVLPQWYPAAGRRSV